MDDINGEWRTIMFFFETSNGPGNVTIQAPPGREIEDIEKELLAKFEEHYDSIEIVRHEVITLL